MNGIRRIRLVNIEAAGGIEPGRLARALTLTVRRIERGRYVVSGGAETHYVDLIDPSMERCDCGDFLRADFVCYHLLACLLREGDERVLQALGQKYHSLLAQNARLRADVRGRTIVLTRAVKARVAIASGVGLDDLAFHRDRDGETSDVTVVRTDTGEVVGRLTRSLSRPEFVRQNPGAAAVTPRIAA